MKLIITILVGWWLVFCVVVFTGFESALISHLTVNTARTKPPETMEDLVKADGWKWGIESWILSGVPLEYFSRHTDPVVMKIYSELELVYVDDGLRKILKSDYSLFDLTYYINIHINSYYADVHGRTPFFLSNKFFNFMSTFGWGFRLGAPFLLRFTRLTMQLEAAGIPTYWLWQLIDQRVKENRAKKAEEDAGMIPGNEDDSREVVLGLDHLQGAFYLLLLGTSVALLTMLGEKFTHSRDVKLQ